MTMKACVLDSSIFRVFPEVIVPDAYDDNIEMRPALITINHDHILKVEKVLIKKSVVLIGAGIFPQKAQYHEKANWSGLGVCLSCAQATVEILKKVEITR